MERFWKVLEVRRDICCMIIVFIKKLNQGFKKHQAPLCSSLKTHTISQQIFSQTGTVATSTWTISSSGLFQRWCPN